MTKIEVFFQNGNLAKFELDKVAFLDSDRGVFGFDDRDDKETTCFDLLLTGPVVNWSAVSFVRMLREEGDG